MARKRTKAVAQPEGHTSPLSEQIAALAHALWQERGCPEGSAEEDWFNAEHRIREQLQRQAV
jgi:hypothetical protein